MLSCLPLNFTLIPFVDAGNISEPPQSQNWVNLPLFLQSVKAVKVCSVNSVYPYIVHH